MMRIAKTILLTCLNWIPLSTRGAVLIPSALLALRFVALQEHDRLLLAACAGGLFLLVALALVVLGVGLTLRLYRPIKLTNIDAIETVKQSTGLTLPSVASMPCIVVDIRWLNCSGIEASLENAAGRTGERILAKQRLYRSEIIRQFEIADVFGLCRVKFSKRYPQSIRVEPFPAPVCSITQIRRDQQGDDLVHPHGKPCGDFIEMRHYQKGDPLKLVLWKHYARTGQLLVRQPENSITSLAQTIACFVAGPGDEASAGVARTVVTELSQGGDEFLFQADGSASATNCLSEAIEQIIQSADVRHRGGDIISGIASTIQSNVVKHCIAFVPSQPGDWIDHVLAGQVTNQLSINAIIGVDEPTPNHRHRFLPRWAFRGASADVIQLDQIQAVVERLAAVGIPTKILHRRSGQAFSTTRFQGDAR